MQLQILDAGLRFVGIGQMLLIALVVARSKAPVPVRAATVLLMAGGIGYLLNSAQVFSGAPLAVWGPVSLAANLAIYFLWLFAHALFERHVDRRSAAAVLLALLAIWLVFVVRRDDPQWMTLANAGQRLISLALASYSIALAILQLGDDLVEKRRRFKIGFVLVVGLLAVAIVTIEALFGFTGAPAWLRVAQSATIVLAALAIGASLLAADADLLFDPESASLARPALSPAETVLKRNLDKAMADGVYREAGLTIGALAARLNAPEHLLRALVNQRLGYRNFASFLNEHRIADARRTLADPDSVRLPVLTIAMDLGYGSLAPFNRAFREATAMTPTDFRRSAIAGIEKS